jgi:hypothetical protein
VDIVEGERGFPHAPFLVEKDHNFHHCPPLWTKGAYTIGSGLSIPMPLRVITYKCLLNQKIMDLEFVVYPVNMLENVRNTVIAHKYTSTFLCGKYGG